MAYHEKDFQTQFNKWSKHFFRVTGAYELKISKTDSLPFSALAEHQINALQAAKHSCIIHKMPDLGAQNPFDSFQLCGVPAYVVVMFRAKQDEFFIIDIDAFVHEKAVSPRKSLTEARAREVGQSCKLSERLSASASA